MSVAERRGLLIGARIASGLVASGVAVVVIVAVGLAPLPVVSAADPAIEVQPAPAAPLRVCPGAAMRLGDSSGANADQAYAIGAPRVDAAVAGGDLDRTAVISADPAAGPSAAPESLTTAAGPDAQVAGAQLQDIAAPDFAGLVAASCTEPSSSSWLVGGATTVGRTSSLLLANPTEVDARVALEIWGEDGSVEAPGLSGIEVPAGHEVVLSLAGFAPGIESPIVHVASRGGRIVASLQQSIVRGLDAVGVDAVGATGEPATSLVIPGVRLTDTVGTNRALALADWQDVVAAIRVGVPGDEAATVTVRVVPQTPDAVGTSFEMHVDAGSVLDAPLDAGGLQEGADASLADGLYTVYLDSDAPIVAAARISTAVDAGSEQAEDDGLGQAPPSDLAWFSAAPALSGSALVVVPAGPSPIVSIVNPTGEALDLELVNQRDGTAMPVTIGADATFVAPIDPGVYLLAGADGLSIGVSYADAGKLAAFVLSPPRPVAGPIGIRPS